MITILHHNNATMGYIAALFIGISLGLIGGGGSILTLPVLVYFFGISPVMATSYSLFVVGSASLVGSVKSYRSGLIDFRIAMLFGVSSIITVFLIRKLIIPAIPNNFSFIGMNINFPILTMVLFAILMLLAAVSMMSSNKALQASGEERGSIVKLIFHGIGIGLITGFLGAGGGFLLIPALAITLHLPIKKAIGTSLLIIALNSSVGFAGDLGHYEIDWPFLLAITSIAIAGILIGSALNRKLQEEKLKKGFGVFVFLMGLYIIVREGFLK